ncbi:hypothetical protein, partial [Enterobacter hormaechei]|uniref:hypothetical protein n=1 Tax=Enterobacter hormaechei TaxID=158836 RepID=UPI002235591F
YRQTNRKTDTGKNLKPWPVLVDHYNVRLLSIDHGRRLGDMTVTRESMKQWIIECLQEREGSAWPREVSKYVWDSYEAELRDSGDMLYTWQYDIRWAAQQLRNEGTLKPVNRRRDLPWELA